MKIDVLKEYAALKAMTQKELLVERKIFTHSRGAQTRPIWSLVIYRIHEMSYGKLTKATIDRLDALAEGKRANQRDTDSSLLANALCGMS